MNTQKAMAAVLDSRSERETEQRDTAQHSPDEIQIGAITIPADVYLIIKRQRDADEAKLKAHAERLAEALADLRSRVVAEKVDCLNTVKADEALAAWEGAQQ